MTITPIKTPKITADTFTLKRVVDECLPKLKERSVVVITSKIVSICEGAIVKVSETDKRELIQNEADYYLSSDESKYHITLTIKNSILIPTAGIDESNGNGYYVLWPRDPQKTANAIRAYLQKKYNVREVGVIITDSKTTPLRRGTTGMALSHSGFNALNNYMGKTDLFGQNIRVTQANIAEGLAAAAVVVMGEGGEQTPLAIVEDLPFVSFKSRNPTKKELEELHIALEDDLYTALMMSVPWRLGR